MSCTEEWFYEKFTKEIKRVVTPFLNYISYPTAKSQTTLPGFEVGKPSSYISFHNLSNFPGITPLMCPINFHK